jgi:ribosomal protein L2
MALIKSKPTSPGRRGQVRVKTEGLHKGKPFAGLVVIMLAVLPLGIAVADTNVIIV